MLEVNANRIRRYCPACHSTDGRKRGPKHQFEMMITCKTCGTLYAEWLPDETEAVDYDAYYTSSNLAVSPFISKRVEEIVSGFSAYRETNCLLEVGFGAGAMLRAAARGGWNAEGTEVSRTAVEHVRKEGLKVFRGELSEAGYPSGHFPRLATATTAVVI